MTDHDVEVDRLVEMLSDAGLLEAYVNEEGKDALRLTERGRELRTALTMDGGGDPEAALAALLQETTGES
jgi:DNA-binding MarR family transcriptional regulator